MDFVCASFCFFFVLFLSFLRVFRFHCFPQVSSGFLPLSLFFPPGFLLNKHSNPLLKSFVFFQRSPCSSVDSLFYICSCFLFFPPHLLHPSSTLVICFLLFLLMRVTSTNRNKRRKIPRETMNQEVDKRKGVVWLAASRRLQWSWDSGDGWTR